MLRMNMNKIFHWSKFVTDHQEHRLSIVSYDPVYLILSLNNISIQMEWLVHIAHNCE